MSCSTFSRRYSWSMDVNRESFSQLFLHECEVGYIGFQRWKSLAVKELDSFQCEIALVA